MNKVFLLGNLGKDPNVRVFDGGSKQASFSLATNRSYKNRDGEKIKKTTWHNIVCWRNHADIAEQYLKKGSQIALEGHIDNRSWEGEDGEMKYISEVVVDSFTMLGRAEKNETSSKEKADIKEKNEENDDPLPDDDLPF